MNGILSRSFRALHGSKLKQFQGIPGPTPRLPLGTVGEFMGKRQPWEVCGGYAEEFGPMTLIWLLSQPALVLNDPDLIGEVLVTNSGDYYKKDPCKALLPIVTKNSAFTANEPNWAQARANDPFSVIALDQWLAKQVAPLRAVIGRHASQLAAQSSSVDLCRVLQRLSFDTFTVASCGTELGDQTYSDFVMMAKVGTRRMQSPIPIPAEPLDPRFYAARRRWTAAHDAIVQTARDLGDADRVDLLAEMLRANGDLPHEVVRDGVANLTYGGVFSATSAIATTLYLLNQHLEVAERLEAELRSQFHPTDGQFADLQACRYLDCVVREALRYLTPVPIFFRNVSPDRPVQLGGVTVPADTTLIITNWALHRSPQHWRDPDRFDPDRWMEDGAAATPIGSDYFFPFGRGARSCPGQLFALCYIKLALATLLPRVRIDMEPSQPYKQTFFFGVMMPKLKGRFISR